MPAISAHLRTLCTLSILFVVLRSLSPAQAPQQSVHLSGIVRDANGAPLPAVTVRAGAHRTLSDPAGHYALDVAPGLQQIEVSLNHQASFRISLDLQQDRTFDISLKDSESITVRAAQDVLTPDPATQGFSHAEILDANPGRPGVPVSIPGYPTETASGGIKAPQYFAPGVAGDHGEPIAQFFQAGGFLFQNNLTANAHGNGYADPNPIIAASIGGVLVDSAGFNARYGDHSINLAVTYDMRDRLDTFIQATSDGRDGGIAAGWSPKDDRKKEWIAAEALFGNGFLRHAEERQQYKLNALRAWTLGHHELTAYAIGYYGFSRIPGLIPIGTPVHDDTVDYRQSDLTHTAIAVLSDHWQIGAAQALTTGAYFRTYSLSLKSNFGDGLIRQSEFRTVAGGNGTYSQSLGHNFFLLGGLDVRRDAPRGLDLAHADAQSHFTLVTSNDLTITGLSPFAAITGKPLAWMQVYLGLRRDEINFENRDNLVAANSFSAWPGTTSPKLSITLGEPDSKFLPKVSFSFGKAFHANDPRIGTGSVRGNLIIQARVYQMFATQQIAGTEVRLTLGRVANSAELAKIDPDTGLQEDVGPSVNRYLTLAVRRRFTRGFVQASWSEADARDRLLGQPIPEAPRMIADASAGINRLPLGLDLKGEFEYVKAKPLGDGFTGVPLREIRLNLNKPFADGRWLVSLNGQLNNGYTGQTLETLAVGAEPTPFERPTGVPARSYGGGSIKYNFAK
jgi:hypothetical protein